MLSVIVTGLATGALFAATAILYNVMFSTSKVLSITTGHLAMLGGVFGAWFMTAFGWPWWLALFGAIAIGGVFGWLTDLLAIRRVLGRSDEHLWLLSTLALATMVQQAVGLWWGTEPKPFPRLIPQDFSAGIADQKFWLPVVVALLMAAGLGLFYRRTMYGKLFLAMSEDAFAARARGVPTDRIRSLSYVMSGALGGIVGFAAGQLTFAYFALGLTLTLNGFIALAVGGLGSNLGALIGGITLGLLNALSASMIGGEYQQTVSVGLLMVVLLLKPEGLLGSKNVRPV
jgi:branched-chain amino acid transport system permease protein